MALQDGARPGAPLPATIGRYRITGRLGKGAMGVVYSAHDDQMGREVAIKVLMADLESDPETRARFYREAQVTSQLVHRNIITVFDFGHEGDRLYIVMELLKGLTLTAYLARPEHQQLEQKLDLMIQACEGLSVAHARGVVHRDIKPGNLFVQNDGGLKILDFGVARLANSSMTSVGTIVGTPDYMSPEQAFGREVDARSDVFSAAAVFYLMLTGRKPFDAVELPVVLQKVVREDPPPIREHEAPAALASIVLKALQKDRDHRYQRCADMSADLVRFKRHFDTETRQVATAARERVQRLEALAADVKAVRSGLGLAPDDEVLAAVDLLRERYPFLYSGPGEVAPLVAPLRRSHLAGIVADLDAAQPPIAAAAERLRAIDAAVSRGERALAAGDTRTAIVELQSAAESLHEPCARLDTALATAHERAAEQKHREERCEALLAQCRAAERAGNWTAVEALGTEILAIDPQAAEVLALVSRAKSELAEREATRTRQLAELIRQAEGETEEGRLAAAERFINRARELAPESPAVEAASRRVTEARMAAAARDQQARRAVEAVRAARVLFPTDRNAAIQQLQAFVRAHPDAADVADELARLQSEAARLAVEEARRREVAALVQQAEAACRRDQCADALRHIEGALALEPSDQAALQIQLRARARLQELAEAAARAEDASRHVERARESFAAGKLDKAAREAQQALALDPGRADAVAVLADLRRREAEEEAARAHAEMARRRAREIARELDTARDALRAGDFSLAAWAAENVLRIDANQPEAQQILDQARQPMAAAADEDATVDFLPFGPMPDRREGSVRAGTEGRKGVVGALIRKLHLTQARPRQ